MGSTTPETPAETEASLDEVRIAAALRNAFREAVRAMEEALGSCDLSGQRYHLLLVVASAGGDGLGQTALAGELHAPLSRVSVLVRELDDAGLVRTSRARADRRNVVVAITPKGRRVLSRAARAQQQALHRMAGGIGGKELASMFALLAERYLGVRMRVEVL